MDTPEQRLFEADIAAAEFRVGVLRGTWGFPSTDALPAQPAWPHRILWLAAAARPSAPDRYCIRLDLAKYRTEAPTGTFWDLEKDAMLGLAKRPKGRDGSRFAKVFRTDWENGNAFYHPYDRVAAKDHDKWPAEQPHLIWDSNHTIVDYLEEFHALLNSGDYLGV
jgi:hypothetical protein